jgi:hypothetical protein
VDYVTVFGSNALLPWLKVHLGIEDMRDFDAELVEPDLDLCFDDPRLNDLVDGAIGEESQFHKAFGVYAHPSLMRGLFLAPPSWVGRVWIESVGRRKVIIPHYLDLIVSKMLAGRHKDLEFAHKVMAAFSVERKAVDTLIAEARSKAPSRKELVLDTIAADKIIVVGDIHGEWNQLNLIIERERPQAVFSVGDFGYWPRIDKRSWSLDGIKNQGIPIYWAPGNHEDWWSLRELDERGVSEIAPNIYYMRRGSTLVLNDGRRVLFMGGADSIDKKVRRVGVDWFPDEIIGQRDIFDLPDVPVDIVISHTAPDEFDLGSSGFRGLALDLDPSRKALSYILEKYHPALWYFGHWHISRSGHDSGCWWYALNEAWHRGWWRWLRSRSKSSVPASFDMTQLPAMLRLKGIFQTGEVWLNGKPLSLEKSLGVFDYSPTGFSWGYGGFAPAQLALAILLEILPEKEAVAIHHDFKWRFVATLPKEDFETELEISGWLNEALGAGQ